MPLFEPYRPQLQDGERPPVVADLRTARHCRATWRSWPVSKRPAKAASQPHIWRGSRSYSPAASPPKALVLAAEHGPSLVGIAKITRFSPPPDSPPNVAPAGWYLSGVIVAEDHRRRGIGRRLTQARLNWIAERDRGAIDLLERAQSRQHRFAPGVRLRRARRATSRSPERRSRAEWGFSSKPS